MKRNGMNVKLKRTRFEVNDYVRVIKINSFSNRNHWNKDRIGLVGSNCNGWLWTVNHIWDFYLEISL